MGFFNATATIPDLESQKALILKEIERLGQEEEKIQERIDKEQELRSDIEALTLVIKEKEHSVKKILEATEIAKAELDSIHRYKDNLQILCSKLEKDSSNLEIGIVAKEIENENLESSVRDLISKEKESRKIVEFLKVSINELEEYSIRAEKESQERLIRLSHEVTEQERKIATNADILKEFETSKKNVFEQIRMAEERVKASSDNVGKKNDALVAIQNQERELKVVLEKKQKEKEDEWQKRDESVLAREGEISLRESWLKEKEQSLKSFKSELEKHYGKPINIII